MSAAVASDLPIGTDVAGVAELRVGPASQISAAEDVNVAEGGKFRIEAIGTAAVAADLTFAGTVANAGGPSRATASSPSATRPSASTARTACKAPPARRPPPSSSPASRPAVNMTALNSPATSRSRAGST